MRTETPAWAHWASWSSVKTFRLGRCNGEPAATIGTLSAIASKIHTDA